MHSRKTEALKGMEKVAEHINEMQRIHEEYGAIFDHLFRQHQKSCKQPIDLSPGLSNCKQIAAVRFDQSNDIAWFSFVGDLLYYGGVEWLNISDFLGKIKKGLELHAMCFVFKSAVVFLCKERLRQKKKLMVTFDIYRHISEQNKKYIFYPCYRVYQIKIQRMKWKLLDIRC